MSFALQFSSLLFSRIAKTPTTTLSESYTTSGQQILQGKEINAKAQFKISVLDSPAMLDFSIEEQVPFSLFLFHAHTN